MKHWDGDGKDGGTFRMEFQKAEKIRADEEGVREVNCGWNLGVCLQRKDILLVGMELNLN